VPLQLCSVCIHMLVFICVCICLPAFMLLCAWFVLLCAARHVLNRRYIVKLSTVSVVWRCCTTGSFCWRRFGRAAVDGWPADPRLQPPSTARCCWLLTTPIVGFRPKSRSSSRRHWSSWWRPMSCTTTFHGQMKTLFTTPSNGKAGFYQRHWWDVQYIRCQS